MKDKRKGPAPLTAFWDTSAIVPLCCFQSRTAGAGRAARTYARQVAWWATAVEAVSAFNRLWREKNLTLEGKQQALRRLGYLRRRWNEIQPTDEVRDVAERLLSVHKLRAADALQLSAALIWCSHRPRGRSFIAADGDLSDAAEAEGFTVFRLP
jgi:predicted nucleic acid-binding protein